MENNERHYISLKDKLDAWFKWPSNYMFKFIVPNDNKLVTLVETWFGPEAKIRHMNSAQNNYVSISVEVIMPSSESVINIYRKASEVKGLVAL